MPPPVPPMVKAGRMMSGKVPIMAATSRASSMVWAVPEMRHVEADFFHGLLEELAVLTLPDSVGICADHLDVVFREDAADSKSDMAVLSAVWPPSVGSSASGFSRSMMSSTISGVIGSM